MQIGDDTRSFSRLSLVIPAWNEELTIAQALREAVDALEAATAAFEIIVVDDGSSDRTAQIVREAAATDSRIRLVQHSRNLGYGAALRTGFSTATMELVAFTDADCQFHLSDLAYMLPLAAKYEVVCGYRMDRQDPPRRRFLSWGYNTLVSLLMGSPVRDIDCALKIFRRELLPKILPDCTNFFVNTEMLTKARQQGMTIVEVGVRHRPRAAGQSKVALWHVPQTLAVLLPYWWTHCLYPRTAPAAPLPGERSGWVWLLTLVLLGAAAAVQLFIGLDYPLTEPDEARYAEIAREMLQGGDWIVPALHSTPYLHKPPLHYWLTAGSFWLFGTHNWTARLVPAASAWLTILVTTAYGRRIFGARVALLAGLVLLLCVGFVEAGRFLVLDSLLTLWVTLSLFAAHEAIRGERLLWKCWATSAVCCGLGVLTKGAIAFVLLSGPVVAFAWLTASRARPRLGAWGLYLLVVAAVALPWHVAVAWRQPELVGEFIVKHHLGRFLNGMNHPEPFWYFLPVLLIGGMPWSLWLLPFLRYQFSRRPEVAHARPMAAGFYLLASLWCLAFFSVSSCKLPTYILPAFPAMALVLGSYFGHVLGRMSAAQLFSTAFRRSFDMGFALLCASGIVVCWLGHFMADEELWLTLTETCALLSVLLVSLALRNSLPQVAQWAICGGVLFFVTFEVNRELVPAFARERTAIREPEQTPALLRDPRVPLFLLDGEWSSVPFYLQRNDVRNFDAAAWQQFASLLAENKRVIVVCRSARSVAPLCNRFERSLRVSRLGRLGRAEAFAIYYYQSADSAN